MGRFILFILFFTAIPSQAIQFPQVPASSKILTADEVQNYWFNTLRRQPIPRKPSSLHPQKQARWESNLRARKARLLAILNGRHQTSARIAALEHNVNAYLTLGDTVNLKLTRDELRETLEHRARLAALDAQKQSAERVADAAERTADAAEAVAEEEEEDCPDPVHTDHTSPCPAPPHTSPPCPPSPSPPAEPLFPFPERRTPSRG